MCKGALSNIYLWACCAGQVLAYFVATLGLTRDQQQYPANVALDELQISVHHESIQSGGCRPGLTCKRPRAITSRSEWEARFTIIGSVSVNEQLRGAPGLEDIPAAPRVLGQGRWLTPLYPKAHPDGHAMGMAILLQSTSTSTRCPPIHSNSHAWG